MYQILFQLLAIRDHEISAESMGAKHWLWLDNKEIKISARVLQYFGVPIVLSIAFSLSAAISLLFNTSFAGWLGLGYLIFVAILLTTLILYNCSVKNKNSSNYLQPSDINDINNESEKLSEKEE